MMALSFTTFIYGLSYQSYPSLQEFVFRSEPNLNESRQILILFTDYHALTSILFIFYIAIMQPYYLINLS